MPATQQEDSGGIDFWVKMPGDMRMLPVQVTQRGVRQFRKRHNPTDQKLAEFMASSEKRIRRKRAMCRRSRIAFVLVRDFDASRPSRYIAWGDVKALRYAVFHMKR